MMNRGNSHLKGRQSLSFAAALLLAGLSHAAFAEDARKPQKPPIILESTGAYEVGGKVVAKPGDPSQTLSCDHGYVEYFIPAKRRSVGLIMWHSSSHEGVGKPLGRRRGLQEHFPAQGISRLPLGRPAHRSRQLELRADHLHAGLFRPA